MVTGNKVPHICPHYCLSYLGKVIYYYYYWRDFNCYYRGNSVWKGLTGRINSFERKIFPATWKEYDTNTAFSSSLTVSMTDGAPSIGDSTPKPASVKTKTDEEEADDPISQYVGEFGRWQLQLTFLLSLFNIPCTWHIFALTFQSIRSDFWCAKPPYLGNISVGEWKNMSHVLETKVHPLEMEWKKVSHIFKIKAELLGILVGKHIPHNLQEVIK